MQQNKFEEVKGKGEDEEGEPYRPIEPPKKTYFDKCKEVGRIGPPETKLDMDSAAGQFKVYERDSLDIEAISQFSSIRANTAVFSGRYYYEVKLLTAGLMQVGWCTLATPFNLENGVGDDDTSYAYDGFRIKKWN